VYGTNTTAAGYGVFGRNTSSTGSTGYLAHNGVGAAGDSDAGTGVQGTSSAGVGIVGSSTKNDGVQGSTAAAKVSGVYGTNSSVDGYGVFGRNTGKPASTGYLASGGVGAAGQSDLLTGVLGYTGVTAPAPRASTGVMGVAGGSASATGVLGVSGPGTGITGSSTAGTGMSGWSSSGVGIRAGSTSGRAAVFTSPVAQLRLYPASAASHPSSGAAGDLFLTSTGDLWLCKGATWVKLG
jgi:hypothetical protein